MIKPEPVTDGELSRATLDFLAQANLELQTSKSVRLYLEEKFDGADFGDRMPVIKGSINDFIQDQARLLARQREEQQKAPAAKIQKSSKDIKIAKIRGPYPVVSAASSSGSGRVKVKEEKQDKDKNDREEGILKDREGGVLPPIPMKGVNPINPIKVKEEKKEVKQERDVDFSLYDLREEEGDPNNALIPPYNAVAGGEGWEGEGGGSRGKGWEGMEGTEGEEGFQGLEEKEELVGKGGAFNAPMLLSPSLSKLLLADEMSRPQVVKRLWDYIKVRV